MAKRYNPRLAKIHRSYIKPEIAALYGVHKNTVTRWIADGLQVIESRRPILIHGSDLRAFLAARNPPKKKCGSNELYCVGCGEPHRPAFDLADFVVRTATSGNLQGLCPSCSSIMNRGIRWAEIPALCPDLIVTRKEGGDA